MRCSVLLLFPACTLPSESSQDLTSPLVVENRPILDAHNTIRAAAEPRPQPALAPLTWSAALADDASVWAARCVFEHDDSPHGENLFASSQPASADTVVTSWADEDVDYDLASNTCSDVCGHYTQLVWRDTTQVGCGSAWCPNLFDGAGGEYWVCRYDPPGNWDGQRPYAP